LLEKYVIGFENNLGEFNDANQIPNGQNKAERCKAKVLSRPD
jgi:hypothetical protein